MRACLPPCNYCQLWKDLLRQGLLFHCPRSHTNIPIISDKCVYARKKQKKLVRFSEILHISERNANHYQNVLELFYKLLNFISRFQYK